MSFTCDKHTLGWCTLKFINTTSKISLNIACVLSENFKKIIIHLYILKIVKFSNKL